MALFSFPPKCRKGLNALEFVSKSFSSSRAVLAASAYRPFLKEQENIPPLSMFYTQLYDVTNLCLTQMFCCGVPDVVCSNFTSIPSCFHNLSKASFLPASLQMYLTSIPSVTFDSFRSTTIKPFNLDFSFEKNSMHQEYCHQ